MRHPLTEVRPEAVSYRRRAARRGRRAADRFAAKEYPLAVRRSAVHRPVVWSWLRRQPAVCRVADRFVARERQPAVQPVLA